MIAILKKEMRAYFTSVAGYGFLAVLLLMAGLFFSVINVDGKLASFAYALNNCTVLFLILIPVLTMRLFAEEARQKTDQLLFTSPLRVSQIVTGKFLAALLLFLIGMGITVLLPFTLSLIGSIPTAEVASTYIGYILLGSCYIAVGLFISSLTENQIIAAVVTFAVLLLFLVMDMLVLAMPAGRLASAIFLGAIAAGISLALYTSTKNLWIAIGFFVLCAAAGTITFFANNLLFDGVIGQFMSWFSLLKRFDTFFSGIMNLSDVVYYVTFSIAFVFLTIHTIEKRRWK